MLIYGGFMVTWSLDCDRSSHCWLDRSVGKGLYIYDLHKEGGGGGVMCLQILLFLSKSFVVHFCRWKEWEDHNIYIHIYIYIYIYIYDVGMLIYICMSVYI